jgi:hypothetical protein
MSTTWDRRLRPIESDDLCSSIGRTAPCNGEPRYELTYWSAQGRFRTPARSRRLLCEKHARAYITLHEGAVARDA